MCSRQNGSVPEEPRAIFWARIDTPVGAGFKSFLSRLSWTEKSFESSPNRRPYENMFLGNLLISIFRYCPYFNQDMSPPEVGKRI